MNQNIIVKDQDYTRKVGSHTLQRKLRDTFKAAYGNRIQVPSVGSSTPSSSSGSSPSNLKRKGSVSESPSPSPYKKKLRSFKTTAKKGNTGRKQSASPSTTPNKRKLRSFKLNSPPKSPPKTRVSLPRTAKKGNRK